jgi:hypothetical protein
MKNLNISNIFVTKQHKNSNPKHLSQSLKKLHIYFKTRVVNGILGQLFFYGYDIDIHELNLGPCRDLKFLDDISFK